MLDLILYIIGQLVNLYATVMLVYCLLTWFIHNRSNIVMRVLAVIAEPPLVPIRKLFQRSDFFRRSPIDYSPLVLFLVLRLIMSLLQWLARLV